MRRLFILLGMWLVGIAGAHAFDVNTGEVLRYDVYWGPMPIGKAQLEYVPDAKGGYELKARAWDQSSFVNIDDTWHVAGTHGKAGMFIPKTFHALQKENKYRADKVLTFDAAKKEITYVNRRSPDDTREPLKWDGAMRDVLSALYIWRVDGLEELKRGGTLPVLAGKRPFEITKQKAVKEKIQIRGSDVAVWRVNIVAKTPDKDDAQTWIVRLRDDASLAPVQAVVQTKFGSFRMVMAR